MKQNSIYVCINRELNFVNNKYKHKLYFTSNNYENGKIGTDITLDDNHDWLFAISCRSCNCINFDGFEWSVKIQ